MPEFDMYYFYDTGDDNYLTEDITFENDDVYVMVFDSMYTLRTLVSSLFPSYNPVSIDVRTKKLLFDIVVVFCDLVEFAAVLDVNTLTLEINSKQNGKIEYYYVMIDEKNIQLMCSLRIAVLFCL